MKLFTNVAVVIFFFSAFALLCCKKEKKPSFMTQMGGKHVFNGMVYSFKSAAKSSVKIYTDTSIETYTDSLLVFNDSTIAFASEFVHLQYIWLLRYSIDDVKKHIVFVGGAAIAPNYGVDDTVIFNYSDNSIQWHQVSKEYFPDTIYAMESVVHSP